MLGTVTSVVVASAISWLIARSYYLKTSAEQERGINRVIGLAEDANSLERFTLTLVSDEWNAEYIENQQVYVSQQNAAFSIRIGENDRDFREPWCEGFPDPNSRSFSVYLCINSTPIKELMFVSLDGHRIVVPVPERLVVGDQQHFFWNPESLPFKVGRIIGAYYIFNDIAGVARRCRVEVVNEHQFDGHRGNAA